MSILKIESKPIVYYYKKAGILLGVLNCVVGQEDHILTQEELDADPYRKELYEDTLIFVGKDPLLAGYPIEDPANPGYVRLATRAELVEMGKESLKDGEKLVDHEIVEVPKPNEFAVWNFDLLVWETDYSKLTDGWKIIDMEAQKLEHIDSPNYVAKWDKESETWITDKSLLKPGEKLLEDGKIEEIEKPEDDNEHKYEWSQETWTWENVITEEELQANYFRIIEQHKENCINAGFIFRGYQQKCRVLDMNWITQRMEQVKDDAFIKGQMDNAYNLLGDTTREDLMKVGWVFDHNEVAMFDVLDLLDMRTQGSSFTQSCYIVEELLKSGPIRMDLTLEEYREEVEKYSVPAVYHGEPPTSDEEYPDNSIPAAIKMIRVMSSNLNSNNHNSNSKGHDMNEQHKYGLTGAEVMLGIYLGAKTYKDIADKKAEGLLVLK